MSSAYKNANPHVFLQLSHLKKILERLPIEEEQNFLHQDKRKLSIFQSDQICSLMASENLSVRKIHNERSHWNLEVSDILLLKEKQVNSFRNFIIRGRFVAGAIAASGTTKAGGDTY